MSLVVLLQLNLVFMVFLRVPRSLEMEVEFVICVATENLPMSPEEEEKRCLTSRRKYPSLKFYRHQSSVTQIMSFIGAENVVQI